jgi:hypothetical protein
MSDAILNIFINEDNIINLSQTSFKNFYIPRLSEYIKNPHCHFHIKDDTLGKFCIKYFDKIGYRNVIIHSIKDDKKVSTIGNYKIKKYDTNAERDSILFLYKKLIINI